MTTNNSIFNIEAQRKFLTALADSSSIRVVWDHRCKVPNATGNGVITLPPPGVDDTEVWLYHAHHEISHLFRENMWTYDILKDIKDEYEMMIANCIVDYIAEASRWGEYQGRSEIMDQGRALSVKMLDKHYTGNKNPENQELSLLKALTRFDHHCRQLWDDTPYLRLVDFSPMSPESDKLYDQLGTLSLKDRMDVCDNIRDLHSIVDDILKLIGRESGGKDADGQGEGEGSGEAGDQQGEAGEGKAGEGKAGEGEAGEGEAGEGEDESAGDKPSGRKVDAPACIPSSMKPSSLQGVAGQADPDQVGKSLDFSTRKYIPHTDHVVKPIGDNTPRPSSLTRITTEYNKSTLTKQVRKNLMAMTTQRFEYGKKSGTLSPRSISRMFTSDRPAIFKQKCANQIKSDTAVSLLVDCSGSMGGSKYVTASAAAVSLSNVLSNLRIKHEILGFAEDDELITYVFKEFNEVCNTEKLLGRFASTQVRLGNNCDGESLSYAAERLLPRREKNKVMMVLSDGFPCRYRSGDPHWYLKKICGKIENETPIYLVGLGIQSTSVEDYYRNHFVINDIASLNEAVLTTLKNNILG